MRSRYTGSLLQDPVRDPDRDDEPSCADDESGKDIAGVVHAEIDPAQTDQQHQDANGSGKQIPAPVFTIPDEQVCGKAEKNQGTHRVSAGKAESCFLNKFEHFRPWPAENQLEHLVEKGAKRDVGCYQQAGPVILFFSEDKNKGGDHYGKKRDGPFRTQKRDEFH